MHSFKGLLIVFVGLLIINSFEAFSLDGVIINTKLNCSRLTKDDLAKVTITSDAQLKVYMYCKNDNFTYATENNKISLNIPLTVKMARFCQLDYVAGKKTFETVLNVYRILGEREEMFRVYKLVCDKDDVTKALVTVMINNPYQNPRIIDHFYSKERFINMDLEVRNILDKKLDKLSVHKKVQLFAKAPMNFTGIQARECYLKTDKKYEILKGGCGTGCIFLNSEGFITNGTSLRSSYFLLPPIVSSKATFHCKFRVCSTKCNGNSCINKKKRSISDDIFDEPLSNDDLEDDS